MFLKPYNPDPTATDTLIVIHYMVYIRPKSLGTKTMRNH